MANPILIEKKPQKMRHEIKYNINPADDVILSGRLRKLFPHDTHAGYIMVERPLFHNLMLEQENFSLYHRYFSQFISAYFESGYFEEKVRKTSALIAPYIKKDPTAFCSYEDHRLAVETITNFCLLRSESIRGQLNGTIPSTIKGQSDDDSALVDASSIWVPDMGEIADLED